MKQFVLTKEESAEILASLSRVLNIHSECIVDREDETQLEDEKVLSNFETKLYVFVNQK